MTSEQRRWKFLGQRYPSHEHNDARGLVGSMFQDQHGAFGWLLYWFEHGLILNQYWIEDGDFFEVITLDADGHWKKGNRLSDVDEIIESRMREAISSWEKEEHNRIS